MAFIFNIFWSEIVELNLPAYVSVFEEDDSGILEVYALKTGEDTYEYWHCLNTSKVLAKPGMDDDKAIHLVTIHILPARYPNGICSNRDISIAHKHEYIQTIETNVFTQAIINDMVNSLPAIIHNPEYLVDDAFQMKMDEINTTYNEAFTAIVINYPNQEVASFPMQEDQARQYKADNNAEVKFLRLLHAGRVSRGYNETLLELCDKILEKASLFEPISGYLSGIRQAMEKELETIKAKVDSGEITHYKGYKECLKVYVEYPLPSYDQLVSLITPQPTP